ncbi:MAG TPA: hypothetical protein VMG10_18010 [Gemmataceae bacterium]|nr:hypothetical protein [Gemmataceae bacterium]
MAFPLDDLAELLNVSPHRVHQRVDVSFRHVWSEEKLRPAPPAAVLSSSHWCRP